MESKPFALIVDDEWRLAQNLVRFLSRRGYDARAATSVTDANLIITERKPELALIDLKLPDFNGIELCRMLNARYPGMPLLVMSACIDESERRALSTFGVREYLTKPFSLSELSEKLFPIHPSHSQPLLPRLNTVQPRPTQSNGSEAGRRQPRIVLYSHDTMGLGHMRRNILIAQSLTGSRLKANVLLVSGSKEIGRFELPSSVDCLVLPSYRKSLAGDYESRHLDLQTKELVSLRSHSINAAVSAFDPDVFIVDNVPRGALNELDDTLSGINAKGRTRLVLGLRDVLDTPEATLAEWQARNNLNTIQWHYDEVWVYGDPNVYDLCQQVGFGESFDRKVRFTGYLDARKRAQPRSGDIVTPSSQDAPPCTAAYNLCLVGGGQDGFALAEAFALAQQPEGGIGLLITGPFMEPDKVARLEAIARNKPDLKILGFVAEPTRLLQNARRVVAMGGYNTANEVLAFLRPTLIVPRIRPRLEQLVRAQRLAELGHIDMLHPDHLSPEAISGWLRQPDSALPHCQKAIDFSGLERLADYVEALTKMTGSSHASTR
ncbi:MAG: response regulator [Gammaproteobacteria bacterium]|nr:response regulator [Gammaproteobacteria bacterium]